MGAYYTWQNTIFCPPLDFYLGWGLARTPSLVTVSVYNSFLSHFLHNSPCNFVITDYLTLTFQNSVNILFVQKLLSAVAFKT